ncbi:MAG: sn-glycerol-3-phosphate ABC transporter ATP-binding protein UgpC [Hyphomicrobiaceae bacterium]|nr:sn-glycerol-3-phosphate ABC transporter ATP-binding protein UgpC [Hyphomicrobiaceae bacterium]
MANLSVQNLHKSFGVTKVLEGIDLDIASGEFVVLLGPSGCGKSTLLRIIAGLEDETSGDVLIDGESIAHLPPAKRQIAMVFQTYALYPHLTVRGNMALVLKQAGHSKEDIDARVAESARALELDPLMDRKPAELSGGQRQRVAIGRAIVRHPKVFLFDEPLSNLDAALRGQVRIEIAQLHQRLSATMVYVTHDQVEAMTLADRIVVLNKGIVQQIGSPRDLYERPENLFVAGFIGSPAMNFLTFKSIRNNEIELTDGSKIAISGQVADREGGTIGVRPAACHLVTGESAAGLSAQVLLEEYLGDATYVHVKTADGTPMIVREEPSVTHAAGANVRITLDPDHIHLFDLSGHRIG